MTATRDFRLGDPDDGLECVNCGRFLPRSDLDRLLWCRGCIEAGRERAQQLGWGIGAVAGLLTALYIWVAVRPSDLVLGGWAACVVGVVWLGARFGREIVFGIYRSRGGPRAPDEEP